MGAKRKAVSSVTRLDSAARDIATVRVDIGELASLRAIAARLRERGIAKPGGGTNWTAADVRRVLARAAGRSGVAV